MITGLISEARTALKSKHMNATLPNMAIVNKGGKPNNGRNETFEMKNMCE